MSKRKIKLLIFKSYVFDILGVSLIFRQIAGPEKWRLSLPMAILLIIVLLMFAGYKAYNEVEIFNK